MSRMRDECRREKGSKERTKTDEYKKKKERNESED